MPRLEVGLPVVPRGILVSRIPAGGTQELNVPAGPECTLYLCLAGSVTLRHGDARIPLEDGDLAVLYGNGDERPSQPARPGGGAELLRAGFPGKSSLFGRSSLHLAANAVAREPSLRRLVKLARAELEDDSVFGSRILQSVLEALLMALQRSCSQQDRSRTDAPTGICDERVARALRLMLARPGARWSVAALAKAVALSRASFARRFLKAVGTPPLRYLAEQRFELAAELLTSTDASLAEIAQRAGYASEFAFSRAFKRRAGLAPAFYRKRARAIGRVLPFANRTAPLALAA